MAANVKVVIVGCGISGIAAAHRLLKHGFHNVRILEATERSGGRIKTGKLGERRYTAQVKYCTHNMGITRQIKVTKNGFKAATYGVYKCSDQLNTIYCNICRILLHQIIKCC